MKSLVFLFALLLASVVLAEPPLKTIDPNKRTVCSMTLNSDEERAIFVRQVERDRANFNAVVELTSFGTGDNWFQAACRSGIRCDIVVISGHFSDRFSGTHNGMQRSLKLDDMERAGCQNSCEGILDHPYEVFLLGCNTLATKAPDSRTPDDYLAHLLKDGVPQSRAELITEARYGRTGDDNKSRIERAFRGQKKMLYGFTAEGPSGATIDRMLKEYFQKKPLRTGLASVQAMRSMGQVEAMNSTLAESLNLTAFDQCGAGDDGERDRRICAMRNPSRSIDNRLSIMEDALTDDDWIKYIPTFNNFLRQNPPAKMTRAQRDFLSRLSQNPVIGRQARALERTSKYPAVRAEWAFFNRSIGFSVTLPTEESTRRRVDPIGDIIEERIGPDFLKNLPADPE